MARLGTILLVDDAQNDIDLLLPTFQQVGIQNPVAVCRSGQEAIDYLSDQQNAKPALILPELIEFLRTFAPARSAAPTSCNSVRI